MTRNVVFWSGGLDSTLVALQLLRADTVVNLVTFIHDQIGSEEQQSKERLTRKHILEKLKSEFGLKISHEEYTWYGHIRNSARLNQATMWLCTSPLLLDDEDNAYYGFLRRDDFWHYKVEFEDAFNAICKFMIIKCKLEYPLQWEFKKNVIKKLKKLGYYDLCYFSHDQTGVVKQKLD